MQIRLNILQALHPEKSIPQAHILPSHDGRIRAYTIMAEARMKILRRLNRDALLQAASICAGGWTCEILGDPILSSTFFTLRIKFIDRDPMWAARIPLDQEHPFYKYYIQPLDYLERYHPTIPAPRVHGYVDVDVPYNPVGVGYMFYEWIEGRPLPPWSLAELPLLKRQRVLDQLAEHILELFVGGTDPDPRDIRFYGTRPHSTPRFDRSDPDSA